MSSATFDNVDPELAERATGVIYEGGTGFWPSDGWRSLELQWFHYNNMIEAQRKYGSKWRNYAPLAAYPGTSDHGRTPARAVDIACLPHLNAKRDELFAKWGLWQNVDREPWHGVLHPKRKAIPKIEIPEEYEVDRITSACMAPSGLGAWLLNRDGAVEAHNFDLKNPLPHFGSMHDLPRERDVKGRYFVHIEPVSHLDGKTGQLHYADELGYWIISNDGGRFKFNRDTVKK